MAKTLRFNKARMLATLSSQKVTADLPQFIDYELSLNDF